MDKTGTKKKIFYAAAELFAKKCFADVSIRDIASEVGIKAASIYNHYASKQQILDDLLDYYDGELDRIAEQIKKSTEMIASDEEKFKFSVYYFQPEDWRLMGWLIKIVFNEQYRSQKAAEIIFDKSMKQRVNSYKAMLMKISGGAHEKHCQCYAELIARIQLTYALEFVNPAVDHDPLNRPTMEELMTFVFESAMAEIKKSK